MALTKSEITSSLADSSLDLSEVWVVCGAAMVMHEIRKETSDIDLGCSKQYFETLVSAGYSAATLADGSRSMQFSDSIEIFEDWQVEATCAINNIQVSSVADIIYMKTRLGRDKDLSDLRLIEEWDNRDH